MNCYQHLYCRPHMAILKPHLLTFSTYPNLGFIRIYSHAFALHVIFPFIKPFNQLIFSFSYHCQVIIRGMPNTHTHTHTHTRLMALFPGISGWAGTRKAKPNWILLKQETVSGSGSGISWAISKSAKSRSRQITVPAPHHSVFYRPDAIPAAQPTASKHWRLEGRYAKLNKQPRQCLNVKNKQHYCGIVKCWQQPRCNVAHEGQNNRQTQLPPNMTTHHK